MLLARRIVPALRSMKVNAPMCVQMTQRMLVDTTDRLVAVKSLNNPSDTLQFYLQNPDMDTASLEATLRNLAKAKVTKEDRVAIINDERFQRLIASISGRLEVCDGRQLAMIGNALAFFPIHSLEMKELAQRLATVTCRRENAFTPRNLSTLAMSFAALGVRDLFVVDFLRVESIKMMQDFAPADLYILMDAFRRLGVFPRDLFDLIIEKMQDEVDRFTAQEMAETLKVLSAVGLAKGFLIRRLANLALESLHVLPPKTTLSVFSSLAKLRFLDAKSAPEFIDAITPHIETFSAQEKSDFLMALGLFEYEGADKKELALQIVKSYMKTEESVKKSMISMSQVAWAICYFELFNECKSDLESLLKQIFASPKTSNLNVLKLLSEVEVSIRVDPFKPAVDPAVATFPPVWQSGIADVAVKDQERTETSRLYSEIMIELDSLRGASKLVMQRNSQTEDYAVDFLEESSKIVLELDTISRVTPRGLKMRHLEKKGYKTAVLNYWQWRRCRTDADKTLLLNSILDGPLKAAGRK